jgi:2-methylisocitrate lyase-like PEP mutase family enzyme
MLEKIKAVRAMSEAVGLSLFINAKTDAVWLGAGEDAEAVFREAVDRANAYGDAGADCVFIPGDFDRDALVRLIGALRHPLNIVIKESTPPIQVLREIGVRRLSMGSGPMRSAMGHTRRLAREILDSGTYRTCLEGAIPFAEAREGFQGER